MMFRFSLQAALDGALANERAAGTTSRRAHALLDEARAALHVVAERIGDAGRLRDALDRKTAVAAGASAARALDGLHEARRKRLALERLRERKVAEYRAREALRETAEFDESNAARGKSW